MIYLLEKEGLGVKAQRICMDDYFKNIFLQKYLEVRRTTKSEFLVVLIQFLVVEDTRTRKFCCPVTRWKSGKMDNFGNFSGTFETFQIIWNVSMELKYLKFILKIFLATY